MTRAGMTDPQTAVMVALHRAGRSLTVTEIVEALLRDDITWATATVRTHLRVMERVYARDPWVIHIKGTRPRRWTLTPRGEEIAKWRAGARK